MTKLARRQPGGEKKKLGTAVRPTGADVAQLAGVSQSAVSRALRPGGSASSKVRAKVAAAAAALGYRPNHLARAMTTRQTSVIAVIMAGSTTIYYPEVLRELCSAIAGQGCRPMVFMVDDPQSEAAAIDAMASYRIDAAIALVSLSDDHLVLLRNNAIRLVYYNREGPEGGPDVVTCDHRAAGRDAALHLLALGHRNIAVIEGPAMSWVSSERVAGIRAARDEHGNALEIVRGIAGDYSYESGLVSMQMLQPVVGCVSAIIACNDAMAAAAVDVATRDWKLAVPQNLSIVGFDGTTFATWRAYQLTTLLQPIARLCRAAVQMLTAGDQFADGERRTIDAALRQGNSTGPVDPKFRVG